MQVEVKIDSSYTEPKITIFTACMSEDVKNLIEKLSEDTPQVISLVWADGSYSPCMPELISVMGNEINAVVFQAFLCGLMGMGCGAGSVVWEIENWSIVTQTGIYFSIISILILPIAYFTYWMKHSFTGFFSYLGIFIVIFVFVWISELE